MEPYDAHPTIDVGPDRDCHLAPPVGMRVPQVILLELEQHGSAAVL